MNNEKSGLRGIINAGNAKLAVQNAKDKVVNFGKAVGYTLGIGLLVVGAAAIADYATDGDILDALNNSVPTIPSSSTLQSYTVRSGDGYDSIAQYFNQDGQDIMFDVYGGAEGAAQIGDIIKYDPRADAFIGYRNGKQILMNSDFKPSGDLEEMLDTSKPVIEPTNQVSYEPTLEDGLMKYTVPEGSGIGAWRISKMFDGVNQDDVLDLLEGTNVLGGDTFDVVYTKDGKAEYLGLTRNGGRTYVEVARD